MHKAVFFQALIFYLCYVQPLPAQMPLSVANASSPPLYVKVRFDKTIKLRSLKPGDITEGNLASDVYATDRKVFTAGTPVRLTVDHMDRKSKPPSDRWPWVIKAFLPRHEAFPIFKDAAISAPSGSENILNISLLSAAPKTDVRATQSHPQKKGGTASATIEPQDQAGRASLHSNDMVMSFEAHQSANALPEPEASQKLTDPLSQSSLPAGTVCRILLLNSVSASKSHPGDRIEARLLEPVLINSQSVLPAGSLFDGTVIKASPPRMLSRAGALSVSFTGITLPDGNHSPISASLTQVELTRGSHTKIDAEGRLHGDRPGAAWMLINGGVTAGIAKEVDDGTQLVMEAILSGATDASTAGTARIAGTLVSGIFLLTRHGRDVVLPSYTEMSLSLNRPLTLSSGGPAK